MQISDPASGTPFQAFGGEPAVRGLVDRFYDRMDTEPRFALIRALHPVSLEGSRQKLTWFLCGFLGGPNHYVERIGPPMLRARHLPFSIGVIERDQWLVCMFASMEDVGVPAGVKERLQQSFTATADWMRNRPEGTSLGSQSESV